MDGFFFTFIDECCVVIEKNTDKKQNDPYKIIKRYLSLICVGVATIDVYP